MLYRLYRISHAVAVALPRRCVYLVACLLADLYWAFAKKDRRAIAANLAIIFPDGSRQAEYDGIARGIFRNFAKHLVDLFRFEKIGDAFVARYVTVEGEEFVDEAQRRGKGVVLVSAHMGSWELGAAVMSFIGHPLSAVTVAHQDPRIDEFFTRRRLLGKFDPIPIGAGLKRCFSVLRRNGIIVLLGDRGFSDNLIRVDFFGKPALMPKGPAVFSLRTGAAIVPTFMVREKGDTFRLVCERPIYPDEEGVEEERVRGLVSRYLAVIGRYIERYPDQWFIFHEVWNDDPRSRVNTVL